MSGKWAAPVCAAILLTASAPAWAKHAAPAKPVEPAPAAPIAIDPAAADRELIRARLHDLVGGMITRDPAAMEKVLASDFQTVTYGGRLVDRTGSEEVPVEGVRKPVRRDGATGCDQPLREHLPAEDPTVELGQALPDERDVVDASDLQRLEELAGRIGRGDWPVTRSVLGRLDASATLVGTAHDASSSAVLTSEWAARSR